MNFLKRSKRIVDICFALILLFFLSPVMLLIFFFVRVLFGPPVIYKQRRPGLNENVFTLFKFRTMLDLRDKKGELLPDGKRLTPFGKFLRKTSLDELPTLYNVIKGDMSMVGPRPLLIEYLPLYNKEQRKRHLMKPGITGWAQINGRNAITWEEKFKFDVWYIENWSLWLDFRILASTCLKVLKMEGISQGGMATMEKFKGNN